MSAPRSIEADLQPPATSRQASGIVGSATIPVCQRYGHEHDIGQGGHSRDINHLPPDSGSSWPTKGPSSTNPSRPHAPIRAQSPPSVDKLLPQAPLESAPVETANTMRSLPPNIVSPTPDEFLLTIGTKISEPGVGLFVNLDGDLAPRGSLKFSSYPESIVLDGGRSDALTSRPEEVPKEGFVLAVLQKVFSGVPQKCVEIQRWDVNPGQANLPKEWLVLGPAGDTAQEPFTGPVGLSIATSPAYLSENSVSASLRLRRLAIKHDSEESESQDAERNAEEDRFAAHFQKLQANVLLYAKDKVSWLVRRPIIVQLDEQLERAMQKKSNGRLSIDVATVQSVVESLRGQEPRVELEFLTLTYIRQKASLMLFGNLVLQTAQGFLSSEQDKRYAEDALRAADIDPRVILTMVPPLEQEIVEGQCGIWLPQGVRDTIYTLRRSFDPEQILRDPRGPYSDNMLSVVRHYLFAWRKKKGFGSVVDKVHVFRTVDAVSLYVLLFLDQHSPRGPAAANSVRAELNEVVGQGVECFDRAVELFEKFNRIYMLSRLYQSYKITAKVLATWKRIIEGEEDAGGELTDGEQRVCSCLTLLRDASLVKEYGAWLARRNPKLCVRVFGDADSKIKFEPSEVIATLQEKAPGAVKDYLEHLVFDKNYMQYVDDLIACYLDMVLNALESSDEVGNILVSSYDAYRALKPPKPTYRQFLTDTAVDEQWLQNRLHLLQLIDDSQAAGSNYDIHALGKRLAPYKNELVPEMIVLNGRKGNHKEALRLLTHGLRDYDSAIRYCLLGGSTIFHSKPSIGPEQLLPTQDEQAILFGYLLNEYFAIEDLNERLERTAELLERFSRWFDIVTVLDLIPNSWSIELISGFLVYAFRQLVQERNMTVVVKMLCTAQSLRQSVVAITG